MSLLLDTHVFFWVLMVSPLLRAHHRKKQAERAGSLRTPHRDPFDLAAQALDLDLTILSVDPAISLFGCKVV